MLIDRGYSFNYEMQTYTIISTPWLGENDWALICTFEEDNMTKIALFDVKFTEEEGVADITIKYEARYTLVDILHHHFINPVGSLSPERVYK